MLLLPLWLLAASASAAHQIPFGDPHASLPPVTPPPARSLTLRHALHLSHTNRSQPALYKTYTAGDLLSIQAETGHASSQTLRTTRERAWRPSSDVAFQAARRSSFYGPRARAQGRALSIAEAADEGHAGTLEWGEVELEVPDVRDVVTLASLAKMTSNAYTDDTGVWYDLDGTWNVTESFGWLEDGIRGHVFADDTNSTVVIAIKGTSNGFLGGGGPTSKNDKVNDNLLFSCCCARIDWSWSTVCDCYAGGYSCNQDCLEKAVMDDSAYYPVATDLYNNITSLYPHAQIWLAGHSLGGSLAAMLSLTYGVPSVSFEAPGDLLASRRLHLPLPPGNDYTSSNITTHVYHTADPIAMGVCNGALSSCAVAGFALESRCHTGRSIVYDTVGKLGWSVDIRTHRINAVIDNLLVQNWVSPKKGEVEGRMGGWGWWPGGGREPEKDPKKPKDDGQHGGHGVPDPIAEDDCVDCFRWDFV